MRSPYERQPRHSPPPDDRDAWMARLDPTGETACRDVMRDQRQTKNQQPSGTSRGASTFRRTER